jgi:flagellar basal body-associated protein FliL
MSGDEKPAEGAAPKPKSKAMLFIILGVVLVLAAGGGALVLAPKLAGANAPGHKSAKAESKEDSEESEESEDEEKGKHKKSDSEGDEEEGAEEESEEAPEKSSKEEPPLSVQWAPLVVDVHDEAGEAHHVKVVVTAECKDEHGLKTATALQHRGRAKVIAYLRATPFEELTDGKKFPEIEEKIGKIVKASAGKAVKSVWVTDFVAQ